MRSILSARKASILSGLQKRSVATVELPELPYEYA